MFRYSAGFDGRCQSEGCLPASQTRISIIEQHHPKVGLPKISHLYQLPTDEQAAAFVSSVFMRSYYDYQVDLGRYTDADSRVLQIKIVIALGTVDRAGPAT